MESMEVKLEELHRSSDIKENSILEYQRDNNEFLKPPKVNYDTRKKMKGKGGSVNLARNKKIVQDEAKKEFIKSIKDLQPTDVKSKKKNKKAEPYNVLNRFLPKRK